MAHVRSGRHCTFAAAVGSFCVGVLLESSFVLAQGDSRQRVTARASVAETSSDSAPDDGPAEFGR